MSQKSKPPPPPPIPPKNSIRARPYGFKNLYPSKKPATVTQQLTKSIDFRQNYVCDCHLWTCCFYRAPGHDGEPAYGSGQGAGEVQPQDRGPHTALAGGRAPRARSAL